MSHDIPYGYESKFKPYGTTDFSICLVRISHLIIRVPNFDLCIPLIPVWGPFKNAKSAGCQETFKTKTSTCAGCKSHRIVFMEGSVGYHLPQWIPVVLRLREVPPNRPRKSWERLLLFGPGQWKRSMLHGVPS